MRRTEKKNAKSHPQTPSEKTILECEHGIRYEKQDDNTLKALNPEPGTGDFGCSRCLYLGLSLKPRKYKEE